MVKSKERTKKEKSSSYFIPKGDGIYIYQQNVCNLEDALYSLK